MKKRKTYKLLKNKDFIYTIVCFAILIIIIGISLLATVLDTDKDIFLNISLSDFLDIQMLSSVIAVFLLNSIATLFVHIFTDVYEDRTKLDNNYDALIKKYEINTKFLTYRNSSNSEYKLGRKNTACKYFDNTNNCDFYKIPVADIIKLYGNSFVIEDNPSKIYSPPEFSKQHYNELISAHGASRTYNQTNIRLDDIYVKGNNVYTHFSRTTYYDSLITNRALDYKIGALTMRELYSCGPFLKPLKESSLSNHIGFNGMVETSDNKFVFIKRHKHVSIAKNTMQCSIASSLKTKYALNKDGYLTKDGIIKAMINEISDELNLEKLENYTQRKEEIFKNFSFENNVLYFYRDLLEGGKPQLMFYAKLNLSSDELKIAYTKGTKRKQKNHPKQKLYCSMDGYKMLLVDKCDLKKIYITPDELIIGNKWYPSVPSAVGTVVMLINAIEEGIIDQQFPLRRHTCDNNRTLYNV